MSRMRCLTIVIALAAAGLLAAAAASPLQAQTARSWCLILPGGEPGGCGFPTLQACQIDSAGYGTCIASEHPAWGQPAAAVTPTMKRKR